MVASISSRIQWNRAVRVVCSTLAEVPTTIGFFRPVILLPISTLTSLSAKELESILAHELAHVYRGDFLLNVFLVVLEVLFFYHPAAWWLSQRIRQEREHACDDVAIRLTGNRLHYARALAAVAEGAVHNRLAMASSGGRFLKRIHRILGRRDAPQSSSLLVISAGVLATILVVGTLALVRPAGATASDSSTRTQGSPAAGEPIKPISGTILDPRGEPLAGVTVYLRRRPFRHHDGPLELAQFTTEDDGRFTFRDVEKPTFADSHQADVFPLDVIAVKPGHSIRWRRLSNAQTDISIQLKKESQFVGVLKDDAGNPVASAAIRVRNLMSLNTITKIDVGAGHTPSANGDSFLDISQSVAQISATTDQDGKFVLRSLPHRVGMVLGVDDRRFVDAEWYAATTDEKLPEIRAGKLVFPPRPETVGQIMQHQVRAELVPIHTSPAELAVTRGAQLQFHVLSDATDEPVPGVTITAATDPPTDAITDQVGRCDFFGLARTGTFALKVLPPDTTDLLGWEGTILRSSELRDESAAGLKRGAGLVGLFIEADSRTRVSDIVVSLVPQAGKAEPGSPGRDTTDQEVAFRLEFRLKRGAVITGHVIDADSRAGVPDAAVSFVPEAEEAEPVIPDRVATNQEGAFRLVVPETPGRVVLLHAPHGYVMPRTAEGEQRNRNIDTPVVTPGPGNPIEGLAIEIKRQPTIPFEFVATDGAPVAVTAAVRIYSRSNTYLNLTVEVDDSGNLDVSRLVRGSQVPKAIQILARSADDRLAAFFRSKDISALQGDQPRAIVLRPAATVHGRITDKRTGAPIPGAKVSLSVSYTATSGQGVAGFTCDEEGKYEFERLVPGMRYSIGARADDYLALNSIHNRFVADEGQSHTVDASLVPKRLPEPIAHLEPVRAPSVDGLSAEEACDALVREYDKDNQSYRDLFDKYESDGIASRIVELREPTPVYAEAFMKLANDNRGSAIELEALKWVCGASLVVGTEHRYRHLKTEAAARLFEDYRDRSEIADAVSNIIYASADRYKTAELLMKSPHHEVQGRACLACANVVAQRYLDPRRGGHDALRERAIELYRKVVDDYSDISHWNNRSIAATAENKLFELKDLQIGSPAPEIEGVDLNGRPMKLSEFLGKVVVIHYWQSGIASCDKMKRILEEYRGKPLVVVGVNTDEDRDKTIALAKEQGLTVRHWHDPEKKIHARWSGSWPCTHVIGHDGKILYRGQRKSPQPLEDVLDEAVSAAERSQPEPDLEE